MLNVGWVVTPSLETFSEEFPALWSPPRMTRLWSWLTVQALESSLGSLRLSGKVTQSFFLALHLRQVLLSVNRPPHTKFPDWTWLALLSGSRGSPQVVLLQGR